MYSLMSTCKVNKPVFFDLTSPRKVVRPVCAFYLGKTIKHYKRQEYLYASTMNDQHNDEYKR